MLVECDSRAQRTFFRTFDLDSRCSKQFCLLLMESDWNDLVGRVIEITPANDVQEMAEFDCTARSATTRDFSVLSSDSLGDKNRPVSQVIALLKEMSTQLQTGARFSLLVKMPWNR